MNLIRRPMLMICLILPAVASASGGSDEDSLKRPVTVSDTIQMTKLGIPEYDNGRVSDGLVAKYSPNGKNFVVVLRKGIIEQNTNEYSLVLWHTDQILHSPVPQFLLRMSSSSNRPAIEEIIWLADNETIAFLGEHENESHQLYTFNINTLVLRRITNHPTDLFSYSITPSGNKIAYLAAARRKGFFDEEALREGVHISSQSLRDLIADENGTDGHDHPQLFIQEAARPSRQLELADKLPFWRNTPFLSPDGKLIVLATYVGNIPRVWTEYLDSNLHFNIDVNLRRGQYSRVRRYTIVDIQTGKSDILLNSPLSRGEEIAWAPDSSSIVVGGTYLPLDGVDGNEKKIRQSETFVVEVQITTRQTTKVCQGQVNGLTWNADTNELVIYKLTSHQLQSLPSKIVFQKRSDEWNMVAVPQSEVPLPAIVLDESMEIAPRILAVDNGSQRRVLLMDLNPQFRMLRFAKIEEIMWKATDGHDVRGGLYYPTNFVPGRRYPLVIQTHGWRADKFLIDGPWTSGYAAQALAGKGIMVLQAANAPIDVSTPEEAARESSAFEGAIEYLDRKGLIDRGKVGIFGFSRSCFHVKYALTHSKYIMAAASVEDGVDGGYFQYITQLPSKSGWAEDFEGMIGGLPFGEGLKAWVERSPTFRIQEVRSPLRIVAHTPASVLNEWEWYAALTRLEKPVEMVMMRDGLHLLQKPREIMIASQGNVDWFTFWLLGREDCDTANMGQYARWRTLRTAQETQQRELHQTSRH